MGAIGTFREKGMSDKAFLEDLYPSMEVLVTFRKSMVIYAAARKRENPETVFALVMPFSFDRNGYFVVKEQDETMGPADAEAPAKVLNLLTETDNRWANEWRSKCRETLARTTAAKAKAKLVKAGTMIRTSPLFFGKSYGSFDTFRYSGRGSTFTAYRNGLAVLTVRITKWRERDFEVVTG